MRIDSPRLAATHALVFIAALVSLDIHAQAPKGRTFAPADMFRVQRVGSIAWSPDSRYATIEITRTGNLLNSIPNNDIVLLDVASRTTKKLSAPAPSYLGFFNAVWSTDGRRVAFLSVDTNAVVRLWTWTTGTSAAREVSGLDVRMGIADPPLAWIDGDRLAVMVWDPKAVKSSPIYASVLRGRNAAEAQRVAADGQRASVSVLESGRREAGTEPHAQLLVLDLAKGARSVLASGRLHRLAVTPDGCCISFLRQSPGLPGQAVASYFERADAAGNADAGYTAVNWGTERQFIDARSGAAIAQPPPAQPRPQPKEIPSTPPAPGARQLSVAPSGEAAIYLGEGADGSRVWIAGGAGRPLSAAAEIWRANEWMADLTLGRSEPVAYTTADGRALTAWLLLPPNHVAGTRVPMVTIVYPGNVYSQSTPSSFSPFQANFEHPQLFAALGYAVLLPSMPAPKDPRDSHALATLQSGVMPAVDAAIARGLVDPDRLAVVGQSDGGFTVLGLITQTTKFRTAIASAGFSNLVSLYGTLHGESRYGDFSRPEAGQVLRMLQFERGLMGLVGPPWAEQRRYHENSPLLRADKVETPLMLIHGDLDSIPIQQAEEFFAALLRQDKRAVLVRYAGEGHTISGRGNVLDMWTRLERWLAETTAPRP